MGEHKPEESSGARIKRSTITMWVVFERLSKVLTVFIIPLLLWGIRVEIHMSRTSDFMEAGPRYTDKDAQLMRKDILEEVNGKMSSLPPQHFREKVDRIEKLVMDNQTNINAIKLAMVRMEADMSAMLRILNSD